MLRPSYVGDAITVLSDLREDDRLEWLASCAGGAEENLADSIARSTECYTVSDADDLQAHIIWGVVADPEPTVWLLGTNQGQRDCGWILHECRSFVAEFFQRWPHTVCYSAPDNTVHHRWLQWMGFRFMRARQWGPFHHTFLEFRREA